MIDVKNAFWDMSRYKNEGEKSVRRGSFTMEEESVCQKKLSEQNLKQTVERKQKAVEEQNQEAVEEQEKAGHEKEEMEASKTDTKIIVKPDGSRVLLVTTKVCGMQTSMSLEISKPTSMQNSISEDESGYMTGIETESDFE